MAWWPSPLALARRSRTNGATPRLSFRGRRGLGQDQGLGTFVERSLHGQAGAAGDIHDGGAGVTALAFAPLASRPTAAVATTPAPHPLRAKGGAVPSTTGTGSRPTRAAATTAAGATRASSRASLHAA